MVKLGKSDKVMAIKAMPNVFETSDGLKGNWNQEIFNNQFPITLEIGCGYGEYSTHLAQLNNDRNYIGIDVKGARLYTGATIALDKELDNVKFIRSLVENLEDFFGVNEIAEIWIPFPDPQPQPAKAMKRLTSIRFLGIYRHILKHSGIIHFKTDNQGLYEWTIDSLTANSAIQIIDINEQNMNTGAEQLNTRYEKHFTGIGFGTHYAAFRFLTGVSLPTELELKSNMPIKSYIRREFNPHSR
ncbi:MAG: tRNA (guanosine(46)-N7)-methyltransferase TrmB [Bacteroidota bacterium]|nr:tRNA (guanosine(46)-N7)-methyltransferase TrmB [Bacteroidota bacterium]